MADAVAVAELVARAKEINVWWFARGEVPYQKRLPQSEASAARTQFSYALLTGLIERRPCDFCGATNSHGHHEDYGEPLQVWFLCPFHHRSRHRQLGWGIPATWKSYVEQDREAVAPFVGAE